MCGYRSSDLFAHGGRVCASARVLKQQIDVSELTNAAEPMQKCLQPPRALEISGSLGQRHLPVFTCAVWKCELIPSPCG